MNNMDLMDEFSSAAEAETRLADIAERYRLYLHQFNGIAYQMDPLTFELSLIGGGVEELTGYLPGDFISGGLKWDHIVHTDDILGFHKARWRTVKGSTPSATLEYRIVRKDGSIRWVQDYFNIAESSRLRIRIAQGAVHEITARKESESLLARRLDAHRVVIRMATEFLNITPDRMESALSEGLGAMGHLIDAERAYVYVFDRSRDKAPLWLKWFKTGVSSLPVELDPVVDLTWEMVDTYSRGEHFIVRKSANGMGLPNFLRCDAPMDFVSMPLISQGRCQGFLAVDSISTYLPFGDDEGAILRSLAGLITHAWIRKSVGTARLLPLCESSAESALPESSDEVEAVHSSAEQIQPPISRPARILLVDDDIYSQRVALMALENFGLHADVAGNGDEAINAAKLRRYDAILMDCDMPLMNGYEATKCMRSLPDEKRNKIPIIGVTAYAMGGDREKCIDSGMNDYLPKPYRMEDLIGTLRKWLPPECPSERVKEQCPAVAEASSPK